MSLTHIKTVIVLFLLLAAAFIASQRLGQPPVQAYDQGQPHNCTTIREYPQCGLDPAACSRYYTYFPEKKYPPECINNGCPDYFFWIEKMVCDDIDGYLYRCSYEPWNSDQCSGGGEPPPPPPPGSGGGDPPPPPPSLPPGPFVITNASAYCANQGQQNAKVYLEWSQSANADYYKVFLGGQGGKAIHRGREKCVGEETFLDPDESDTPGTPLSPGNRTYAIQAIRDDLVNSNVNDCDIARNCSTSDCQTWSNSVTVYVPDCSAPPGVDLKVKKTGDSIASRHAHDPSDASYPPLEVNNLSTVAIDWSASNSPSFCQATQGSSWWTTTQWPAADKPLPTGSYTTASLPGPGTYLYNLTCYNSKGEQGYDFVQINVKPPSGLLPWLQTLFGNVHSNFKIDVPGGP